ncbi:MAG: 5'-methylthioadenosine/S-adenosylhomocysteine nucleosidase, partial [Lentisphaeria bacterium]|nr:5'-methylthioadenosine/S-adenosylhomocysteine nucleosidase [Lentisphaeria bacterium]
MRIGFLVPTDLESKNLHQKNEHVTCAGYGAGKVAACSAAAELVFDKYCDTIIVWGLAGGLSRRVNINDIVIGSRVAYRDYNISPLFNSTGVGWVDHFSENVFVELDPGLRSMLKEQVRKVFPDRNVLDGTICTGDQFVEFKPGDSLNRVERESDVVDMESAAVVHFCHNLKRKVKVGIVRVISDNADHNANLDFNAFLNAFGEMNGKL